MQTITLGFLGRQLLVVLLPTCRLGSDVGAAFLDLLRHLGHYHILVS
jgi:hypothetical protein